MSKTLKELTWEQHKNAERQWFAKQMITGRVEPSVYHKYLVNQYACYDALESNYGVPVNAIARAKAIMQDIEYFTPNEFELYPLKIIVCLQSNSSTTLLTSLTVSS